MSGWRRTVSVGTFLADLDGPDFRAVDGDLAGWYDPPAIRDSIEDRSQQDGGFDSAGFYSSRVVTINARVEQASRAAALALRDEIDALSPQVPQLVVVDDPDLGPRSSLGMIVGNTFDGWMSPVGFRYTLTVKCTDPLKYGPEVFASTGLAGSTGGTGLTYPLTYPRDYGLAPGVTPGALTISNAGKAAYFPRLRIDGPVPNPTVFVAETGDSLRYNGTLTAGQWLDIDTRNRRVLLNGQVSHRYKVASTGRWLSIPAGGASIGWTADAADPAALLSVWSRTGAWL